MPEYVERKFTDPTPYVPPRYQGLLHDPFFKLTPTHADETIEEAESGARAAVSAAGREPGESEYSWGRGLMNSPSKGPGPTPLEVLKAQQRTNPADPADVAENHYADWTREP